MKSATYLLMASALLSNSACNADRNEGVPQNDQGTAAAGAQSLICTFEPSETRNWTYRLNADQSVAVMGEVYVGDPKYRAELFQPEVTSGVATVYLTRAENTTGQAPADGWWPVERTIPDNGSIRYVDIKCDMEKLFKRLSVRRGAAPVAATVTGGDESKPDEEIAFQGCPILLDVSGGCLVVKSGGEIYEINSAHPRPDPDRRLIINGTGIAQHDTVSVCMSGTPLTDVKWNYTKTKCAVGDRP